MKRIFLATIILLFSGCWDSVELEDRAFIMAFGFDAAEDEGFRFYAAIAQPSEQDSGSDDNDENEGISMSAEGQTPLEAIQNTDAKSSRDLYFGQAKTVVFGKKILENQDLFKQALEFIESCNMIDRSINVIATEDNIEKILTASPPSGGKSGYYVANFHRLAEKSRGRSLQKNFDSMMADLRSGGGTMIPMIWEEDGGIRIEGGYQLSDFAYYKAFDNQKTANKI